MLSYMANEKVEQIKTLFLWCADLIGIQNLLCLSFLHLGYLAHPDQLAFSGSTLFTRKLMVMLQVLDDCEGDLYSRNGKITSI